MVNAESIHIPGYQGEAELLRYRQASSSSRVLLLLPGQNYAPVRSSLELLVEMALQRGWEVLALRYSFQVSAYSTRSMDLDDLEREVLGVLPFLSSYAEVCLAGKSLGTIMARRLLDRLEAPNRSLLLITPNPEAVLGEVDVDRLCLVGDRDRFLEQTAVARAARPDEWRVYPGADHGLLVEGDWRATAAVWQALVSDAEAFLTR